MQQICFKVLHFVGAFHFCVVLIREFMNVSGTASIHLLIMVMGRGSLV